MDIKSHNQPDARMPGRFSGYLFSTSSITPLFEDDQEYTFPIASVTKTFTAWCCLHPQSRPHLDRPFREILPFFRVQDERATREMTPRDALCHFSGLAPQTDSWVCSTLGRREYIETVLPGLEFFSDYHNMHRYSNVMYAVLGCWLEELTGQCWEDLIDTWIRDPLGLASLRHIEPGWEDICPAPHVLEKGHLKQIPPFFSTRHHLIAPASELMMTMRDLARWGQHHLELDTEDDRWRPHSFVTRERLFAEFGPLHYGLGWRLDTVNGHQRVWHSGQCSGYTTLISLYPDRGVGLAAATNRSAATPALHELDLEFLHRNQTL